MTQDNQSTVSGSSYWSLTDQQRQELIATVPKQESWTLLLKRKADGYWFFDRPDLSTHHELLVGGTEKIIDHYYTQITGQKPDETSQLEAVVADAPIDDADVVLTKEADDKVFSGAATYIDQATGMESWLCPWLQLIFKTAPDAIYVQLNPVV